MSQVKISGNASGTGVLTIAAPNTNTDRTLSLPDITGDIITSGSKTTPKVPAFWAYLSSNTAQTVSSSTYTKVEFDVESFDTDGYYDHSTNYRFTPQVAGYYQFTARVQPASSYTGQIITLYKNGVRHLIGGYEPNNSNAGAKALNCMAHANGSSDYFEVYVSLTTGQALASIGGDGTNNGEFTYFQGWLIRAD